MKPRGWRSGPFLAGFFLLLGAGAMLIFSGCSQSSAEPGKWEADSEGAFPVAVARVDREDLSRRLEITAEFLPYQDVDLHAKVSGYLQQITVDIGDHVKEGQVLATLEIPEIQEDFKKAEAACEVAREQVNQAQAAFDESNLINQRLQEAGKARPGLIAQQDLDTAGARNRGQAAALALARQQVSEAEANKNRIQDLITYSRITAPFDGVITHRYADTGALIQAGTASETQSMPVVRIAELRRLRLAFPVPESAVEAVHLGDTIQFYLHSEHQLYPAKISRCAGKIDTATRTMLTEADIENEDFRFTPGMYASVLMTLDSRKNTLAIPSQALTSGTNQTVWLVDGQNHLQERAVKVGIETPDKVEILSGLDENDMIVVGSRNGLQSGQLVKPKLAGKSSI